MQPNILELSEPYIDGVAQRRCSNTSLASIVLQQAFYENFLKFKKHINFRQKENLSAREAYSAMNIKEFEGINARQRWSNWRTIPRSLSKNILNQPQRTLDLCCGVGHSTEVLAYYLPKGSEIIGLEYNNHFIEIAKMRAYLNKDGGSTKVNFSHQSVLETFCDHENNHITDESVDIINSCGAVGHHFSPSTTKILVHEIVRVLKKGGIVMLDSGKAGTPKGALISIFAEYGIKPCFSTRSCFLDKYLQICFKKN